MSAVTTNWKAVIDRPIAQTMAPTPVATAAGACICSDLRGTDRYIYALFSATSFWRYDVQTDTWQQLPSPTDAITFGAGTDMVFDPSLNRVWLFGPRTTANYAYFQYYDITLNTWTSRAIPAGLAAIWAVDASLVHTCTTYNGAGTDDYIYLIGNNSTTWYRYGIGANAWVASPAGFGVNLTAAAGAGCAIHWCYGYATDTLYIIRATATATIYAYTIGVPAIATITYNPATETFTTGTSSEYDGGTRIYIQKDATQRVLQLNLAGTYTMTPACTFPYTGTAIVGDKLTTVKSTETTPVTFLYLLMNTGQYVWRVLVTW